jgi:hypothetical protein
MLHHHPSSIDISLYIWIVDRRDDSSVEVEAEAEEAETRAEKKQAPGWWWGPPQSPVS